MLLSAIHGSPRLPSTLPTPVRTGLGSTASYTCAAGLMATLSSCSLKLNMARL
jgi:hypothetical protein